MAAARLKSAISWTVQSKFLWYKQCCVIQLPNKHVKSLTFYKISSITFMYATGQQNSTLKIVFRLNGNKVTNGINIDKMEASATGILSWFSKLYGMQSYLNSVLLRYRFIWHRVVGSCVSVFSLVYELLVSIVGVVKVVLVLLLVHCRDQGRQSGICQSHSYTAEGTCIIIFWELLCFVFHHKLHIRR